MQFVEAEKISPGGKTGELGFGAYSCKIKKPLARSQRLINVDAIPPLSKAGVIYSVE
jgi:hypothetical protein